MNDPTRPAAKREEYEELIKNLKYTSQRLYGCSHRGPYVATGPYVDAAASAITDLLAEGTRLTQEHANAWDTANDMADLCKSAERERDDAARDKEQAVFALTQAETERDEARAALKDCANGLEGEVKGRYDGAHNYPSEIRLFERDMAPVVRARAVLAKDPSNG